MRRSDWLIAIASLALAASVHAAEPGADDPEPAPGYRWSENVLLELMSEHELEDRHALLREATRHDNGDCYLNRAELEAAAVELRRLHVWGVISDIDRTVKPPCKDEPEVELPPYPGVSALIEALDRRCGDGRGDVWYVTARTPAMLQGIPEWMAAHSLPQGPISCNETESMAAAVAEKIADITAILESNPDCCFVLLGDSSHRDPEVYRAISEQHPKRVVVVVIHKVTKTIRPDRVEGFTVVGDYAEAAVALLEAGVLEDAEAKAIVAAVAKGTTRPADEDGEPRPAPK